MGSGAAGAESSAESGASTLEAGFVGKAVRRGLLLMLRSVSPCSRAGSSGEPWQMARSCVSERGVSVGWG